MATLADYGPEVRAEVKQVREVVATLHEQLIKWNLVGWTAGNVAQRLHTGDLMVCLLYTSLFTHHPPWKRMRTAAPSRSPPWSSSTSRLPGGLPTGSPVSYTHLKTERIYVGFMVQRKHRGGRNDEHRHIKHRQRHVDGESPIGHAQQSMLSRLP